MNFALVVRIFALICLSGIIGAARFEDEFQTNHNVLESTPKAHQFLKKIRRKRFLSTSLNEECNEGCSFEEVREIKGNKETSHEFMRDYYCVNKQKCPSDHYCQTTSTDYSTISTLKQECWRNGSWCVWSGWGSWSACSATCNPGTKSGSRSRSCNCPSSVGIGASTCVGPSTSSTTASCTSKYCSCGQPPSVNHAQRSGTSYLWKDTVSYTCDPGYSLRGGSASLTCDVSASWSGNPPSCSKLSCGQPRQYPNAILQGSNFLYGDTVSFQCDTGYFLSSSNSTLQCLANGIWGGTTPQCDRIFCGVPLTPPNATFQSHGFLFGDTLSWGCTPGYSFSGDPSSQCLANGTWDAINVTCSIVSCGDPGLVPNSKRILSATTYLQNVTYFCKSGYDLAGNNMKQCQADGNWTTSFMSCKRKPCQVAPFVQYGQPISNQNFYRDILHVKCDDGYELNGTSQLTCNVWGMWTGPIPVCKPIECPMFGGKELQIIGRNISVSGVFTFNSSIFTRCNDGYKYTSGDLNRTCTSSKAWTGITPQCADIDECITNPCLNGGLCINNPGSYTCNCTNNFSGNYCATPVPTVLPNFQSSNNFNLLSLPGSATHSVKSPFQMVMVILICTFVRF